MTGHDSSSLPHGRIAESAEALYRLLPAHVRDIDHAEGSALRALFGVLARATAELDAELDAYYDALFVETANPASLPDLAALVAAVPLHPRPRGAIFDDRAYIANTIRYRRGKGTARVLESLASDVTGYGATVVEYFQRIARLQNLIDPRPDRTATAILVDGDTGARAGASHDRLPRLVDLRSIAPRPGLPAGRHGIPSIGVHVRRLVAPMFPAPPGAAALSAATMAGVPRAHAWPVGAGHFQLAAQPGAALRLFSSGRRSDAADGRLGERDAVDRLRRLPLHLETQELRASTAEGRPAILPERPWFDDRSAPFQVFVRRVGVSTFDAVRPEELRICNLESPPPARPAATLTHEWFTRGPVQAAPQVTSMPITCAVDPVTGRLVAAMPAAGVAEIEEVRVAYATGNLIGAGAHERGDAGLPFEIRAGGSAPDLVWVVDPALPMGGSAESGARIVGSLADALAEVQAAGAGRRSFVVLTRCESEAAPAAPAFEVTVHPLSEVHLIAAEWRAPVAQADGTLIDDGVRGYVIRRERRFTIDAPVSVRGGPGAGDAGTLLLDGLEFIRGMTLRARSVRGVHIRHTTLRSPGAVALTASGTLTSVEIDVEHSLIGAIRLGTPAIDVSGDLRIRDSIVSADGIAADAVSAPRLECCLQNVTVLGSASMRSLAATNVLFTGPATVTRRQSGCVRYSFLPDGSTTPPTFRCQPQMALAAAQERKGAPLGVSEAARARLLVQPVLLDESLDEPTAGMLHGRCPEEITRGGEGETEMGAFASIGVGIALGNLASLFHDFVPAALRAGIIDDTRSAAVAQRRNRP
ncbi:hypothetical protein ACFCVO_00175 [Agromyces sp. NPDC056379]|uniref:hypothetical protein n=1 Tax=unclassified Agromyces TaxID=2639701 RepID=UPI0035D9EBBF